IAHGMPYPQNKETALKLEAIIREQGAVPATIAILGGRIKIGLDDEKLEYLAKAPEVVKASRRDLSYLISQKKDAATTVAATMIGAKLAGIKVFATGGVGGVHRKAQESFDISADLQELANTQVAVISAGVKSILDIPLTLEYLETYGVPVIGVGTQEFPAFYTRESGSKCPISLDNTREIADLLHTHWNLGFKSGALIANPIPSEYSMDKAEIEKVIEQAIEEAEEHGIGGKELTPYLLNRIKELTAGSSLFSNIQLVQNNAKIAAQIAVHLSQLGNES
ncbi:MAG: pseudouridine-5'-phosphate glycosidase, partial [Bacteroidota bacterium]